MARRMENNIIEQQVVHVDKKIVFSRSLLGALDKSASLMFDSASPRLFFLFVCVCVCFRLLSTFPHFPSLGRTIPDDYSKYVWKGLKQVESLAP